MEEYKQYHLVIHSVFMATSDDSAKSIVSNQAKATGLLVSAVLSKEGEPGQRVVKFYANEDW